MENLAQSHSLSLLRQEAEGIETVALELRVSIRNVAHWNKEVPTAGIIDNLIAVVDAWEHNQLSQINSQLTELEPCPL